MGLLKRIWHDPVWSKVIAGLIGYGGAQLVRHWPPNLVSSANQWLEAQVTVTRSDLVIWPIRVLSTISVIYAGALAVRFEVAKRRAVRATIQALSATTEAERGAQKEVLGEPEDLRELLAGVRRLEGRFAEEEEYRRTLAGRYVRCSGAVMDVHSVNEGVTVVIKPRPEDPNYYGSEQVYVTFPRALRERAFGLHERDIVMIFGRVMRTMGPWAYVVGHDFSITELHP